MPHCPGPTKETWTLSEERMVSDDDIVQTVFQKVKLELWSEEGYDLGKW